MVSLSSRFSIRSCCSRSWLKHDLPLQKPCWFRLKRLLSLMCLTMWLLISSQIFFWQRKYVGFLPKFTESVICQFEEKKSTRDDMIIPPNLFEIPRRHLHVEIPFCRIKRVIIKEILVKIERFNTGKRWYSFILENKTHPVCKIHQGDWTCGQKYIGETIQNVETRRKEHSGKRNFEPSRYLHYIHLDGNIESPKPFQKEKKLRGFYYYQIQTVLEQSARNQVPL